MSPQERAATRQELQAQRPQATVLETPRTLMHHPEKPPWSEQHRFRVQIRACVALSARKSTSTNRDQTPAAPSSRKRGPDPHSKSHPCNHTLGGPGTSVPWRSHAVGTWGLDVLLFSLHPASTWWQHTRGSHSRCASRTLTRRARRSSGANTRGRYQGITNPRTHSRRAGREASARSQETTTGAGSGRACLARRGSCGRGAVGCPWYVESHGSTLCSHSHTSPRGCQRSQDALCPRGAPNRRAEVVLPGQTNFK